MASEPDIQVVNRNDGRRRESAAPAKGGAQRTAGGDARKKQILVAVIAGMLLVAVLSYALLWRKPPSDKPQPLPEGARSPTHGYAPGH